MITTQTTAAASAATTSIIATCQHCRRTIAATPKCAVRKDKANSGITVAGQFDWYHTASGEEECA
jgi:hypothetical protein